MFTFLLVFKIAGIGNFSGGWLVFAAVYDLAFWMARE